MELISNIPFLGFVIPFLIMLIIVIYVHEMGHYLVGRWCGIHAEAFSLGFGKEIWSHTDKRGTKWRIAMIPVGGYVKFLGNSDPSSMTNATSAEEGSEDEEVDDEVIADTSKTLGDAVVAETAEEAEAEVVELSPEDYARSFPGASVFRRALTVAAGPVANFILSAVIFTGLTLWQGVALPGAVIGEVVDVPGKDFVLQAGDKVLAVEGQEVEAFTEILIFADALEAPRPIGLRIERNGAEMDVEIPFPRPPLVSNVNPLSPANRAGLEKNDYILSAAGEELNAFSDLQRIVLSSELEEIELIVLRDGEEISMMITPREQDHLERDTDTDERNFTKRVMIGIGGGQVYLHSTYNPGLLTAAKLGTQRVWGVVSDSVFAIRSMIRGDISPSAVQGPIGMAQVSGEMFKIGLLDFIFLVGIISTGIGMLNLFPIPVLDGGHLVIFLYEAITGKQPSDAVLRVAMSIGIGLVLLLMLFATYNDIMRIFQVS